MKKPSFLWMILLLLTVQSSIAQSITLTDIGFTFSDPILATNAGDGSGNLYVVERTGKVRKIANGVISDFMNLTSKIFKDSDEMGLLGLAFHPDFKTNGYVYVNYTTKETTSKGDSMYTYIARFKAVGGTVDLNNELKLLKITQPYTNHKGGSLLFGNDGYLYIALGDGGSGGDPLNNAQNRSVLLGKILRIDVDKGNPYSIPEDNPFVGNTSNFRQEIFAYGLRNPWKMTLDKTTGKIWAADVGQSKEEEIDIIENGKNYGWRIMEGKACYNPSTGCNTTGLELPYYSYTRSVTGTCSVTGGYVYRGAKYPEMYGLYFYGDYCSGGIWSLTTSGQIVNTLVTDTNYWISSFGEDEEGTLYVIDITTDKVYKIEGTVMASIASSNGTFASLRPNPARDQLFITMKNDAAIQDISIKDIYGSTISNPLFSQNSGGDVVVDISGMKSGLYNVSITVGDLVQSSRIVVVK